MFIEVTRSDNKKLLLNVQQIVVVWPIKSKFNTHCGISMRRTYEIGTYEVVESYEVVRELITKASGPIPYSTPICDDPNTSPQAV